MKKKAQEVELDENREYFIRGQVVAGAGEDTLALKFPKVPEGRQLRIHLNVRGRLEEAGE